VTRQLISAAVASNLRSGTAAAGAHISKPQQTGIYNHALAFGFSHGYEVSAGIAVLAPLVSLIFIRVEKSDLEGINPMASPGA